MHDESTGDFKPLADDVVQIESAYEVSFKSIMAVSDQGERFLPVGGAVAFVLAAFQLGIVLQGQEHSGVSSRQIAMMFAESSLVMLGVNAALFLTGLLEKISARTLMSVGLILAMAGLAMLALHRADGWMYVGIGFTAAGTGLVLPVIAYLYAGASQHTLRATMDGLAAAAVLGQTLGSLAGGWLFSVFARQSFAWLALPFAALLAMLILRPGSWSVIPIQSTRRLPGVTERDHNHAH